MGSYRLDIFERQQKISVHRLYCFVLHSPKCIRKKKKVYMLILSSVLHQRKCLLPLVMLFLTAVVTNYELYYSLCLSSNVIFKCLSSETVSLFPVEYLRQYSFNKWTLQSSGLHWWRFVMQTINVSVMQSDMRDFALAMATGDKRCLTV